MLETVTQRFDYFDTLGLPLRARLNVSLKGHDLLERSARRASRCCRPTGPSGGSCRQGDRLRRIAAEECDDPRRWREIAEASGIDNPLTLRAGHGLTDPEDRPEMGPRSDAAAGLLPEVYVPSFEMKVAGGPLPAADRQDASSTSASPSASTRPNNFSLQAERPGS